MIFRSTTTQMSPMKHSMLSSTQAIFQGLQESLQDSLRELPNNAPFVYGIHLLGHIVSSASITASMMNLHIIFGPPVRHLHFCICKPTETKYSSQPDIKASLQIVVMT
jgi:hypothetical protein